VLRLKRLGSFGKSGVGEGVPDWSFRSRGRISLRAGFPKGFFLMLGSGGLANSCRGLQLGSYKSQRFVAGFDPGVSNNDPGIAGVAKSRIADTATAECLNTCTLQALPLFELKTNAGPGKWFRAQALDA
jgi:hypothetical protein